MHNAKQNQKIIGEVISLKMYKCIGIYNESVKKF